MHGIQSGHRAQRSLSQESCEKMTEIKVMLARVASVLGLFAAMISSAACSAMEKPTMRAEDSVEVPTPPATIPEMIDVLRKGPDIARLGAARSLGLEGPNASAAVPTLVASLSSDDSELREAAAWALGQIGDTSEEVVLALAKVLLEDVSVRARVAAARAIGETGANIGVPFLARGLDDKESEVQIRSAESLSRIMDLDLSEVGSNGYSLDEDGVPLIVVAAREWWTSTGQYEDWGPGSTP